MHHPLLRITKIYNLQGRKIIMTIPFIISRFSVISSHSASMVPAVYDKTLKEDDKNMMSDSFFSFQTYLELLRFKDSR